MRLQRKRARWPLCCFLTLGFLVAASVGLARTPRTVSPLTRPSSAPIKVDRQDDFLNFKPAADLALRPEGERRASALTHFVEGMALEENGEMDRALESYRQVLNVDPGQSELASRDRKSTRLDSVTRST